MTESEKEIIDAFHRTIEDAQTIKEAIAGARAIPGYLLNAAARATVLGLFCEHFPQAGRQICTRFVRAAF